MIRFTSKGNFKNTESILKKADRRRYKHILTKYAQEGVVALSKTTPVDSGETSRSWYYEIEYKKGNFTIHWKNSNIVSGVPIALIIQYGHGTRNGGYVRGIDYINPTLKPIFNNISEQIWREMTN